MRRTAGFAAAESDCCAAESDCCAAAVTGSNQGSSSQQSSSPGSRQAAARRATRKVDVFLMAERSQQAAGLTTGKVTMGPEVCQGGIYFHG